MLSRSGNCWTKKAAPIEGSDQAMDKTYGTISSFTFLSPLNYLMDYWKILRSLITADWRRLHAICFPQVLAYCDFSDRQLCIELSTRSGGLSMKHWIRLSCRAPPLLISYVRLKRGR